MQEIIKFQEKIEDEFSYHSHKKAINAIQKGFFKDEIVPVEVEETYFDGNKKKSKKVIADIDEGPISHTSLEALAKLKPVFAAGGTVTAGNSSQTSDGAAFVLVMSEDLVKELNLKPMGRLISYSLAGVNPRIMGIGPVKAIPKALSKAGMKLEDIDLIELNEAFASQALAVVSELGINPEILNVNGGQ